jgi:hypothetical protein
MSSAADFAKNDDIKRRPLIVTTRRSVHVFELRDAVLTYDARLARERLLSRTTKEKTSSNDKVDNQVGSGDDNQCIADSGNEKLLALDIC